MIFWKFTFSNPFDILVPFYITSPMKNWGFSFQSGLFNNGLGISQTLKMEHYICKIAPVEANTKQQPFRLLAK
ncbi:hypothetical protein D7004_13000 [Pedobacter jejuensis]|uniref:Uncharacterized protein n=1 Tax=Pedobacter jejuensis TaxID=1268550 RepID=A0A3N0BTP5_9SPHI|nr:hypothetical protein D7004_13000 [Pedobacter jejuensis]